MTERESLVETIRERGVRDPRVLDAFAKIDRAAFTSDDDPYANRPLPIGHGQTISQPLVVALTAEALQLRGDEHVLDVGTGSGYAAAILSKLAREVDTIERIPELCASATIALAPYANVHVHQGDGSLGFPSAAPYDAIAVGASPRDAPPALLEQLAIGGRLVIPIGDDRMQLLVRITRTADGYERHAITPVHFVPLIGAQGWDR
ncbi:MAG: protein-L-isoaspartate(D-aspartate) O-methyltransferase [Kofleriaceae bacterium]